MGVYFLLLSLNCHYWMKVLGDDPSQTWPERTLPFQEGWG